MTQAPDGFVPELTLPWKMRLSLAHSGQSIDQIAKKMGVSRQTVGRWLNGAGGPPTRGYLTAWAVTTGVSMAWLLEAEDGVNPGSGVRNTRIRPALRRVA